MKLTDMEIEKLPDYINLTEAAERLGISRQWIYKRAQRGEFKSLRQIGDQPVYVVSVEEVEFYRQNPSFPVEPELTSVA